MIAFARRAVALCLTLPLAACNENNIKSVRLDAIAVVYGDFDNMKDALTALDIASTPYDGFIVQATYLPEDERLQRGYGGPRVEDLLTDTTGELELSTYNAVFVNSGTRGLGSVVYNNPLEQDDALLAAGTDLQDACDFANGGGTLVLSDWAYDLIEYCWPDAIEFYGDDTAADAAQVGVADGELLGDVTDETLLADVGALVTLNYNYSAWAVVESVGADTEVLMLGTAEYQPSAAELPVSIDNSPLLMRFPTGRSGQVLYSTFALSVQTPGLTSAILLVGVDGLFIGAGSESATGTDTTVTGTTGGA